MKEIKLFPLGAIVLPEGKMKLRIFEPRYKRLVKEASQSDNVFGICLFDSKAKHGASQLSDMGTLVKIVDFETLPDGLLGITVVGVQRFKIQSVRFEFDNLRVANVDLLENWPSHEVEETHAFMINQLQDIYQQFPDVKDLHQHVFLDDLTWVSLRWLELLPVSKGEFDYLIQQPTPEPLVEYLLHALNHVRLE